MINSNDMIKYKNYSNINNENYMELDYKFLTLLKLAKHCHNSASWGDSIFIEKLISSDIPSLPTNLDKELKLNPFLRCHDIDIKNKVTEKFDIIDDELEIFTALRKWKDNF